MKCKNCEENDAVKYSKYSNGNFCCRKCARAYSSKEKRKEINKKVSSKLKGRSWPEKRMLKSNIQLKADKKCKSCGCEMKDKSKKAYCKLCRPFVKNLDLFKKLKIYDKELWEANQKALTILTKEYFADKQSLNQIREKYGIMYNTVHFFFKKNGIDLRSLSKAQKLIIKNGRKALPVNLVYKTGYHTTWYGKEFFYRSSYEKRMMEILDKKQEFYLYETLRIQYEFKKEISTHITDFYIPEKNLVIETKGEWFQKRDKDKIEAKKNAILAEGYCFMMLGNKELKQYEKGIKEIL